MTESIQEIGPLCSISRQLKTRFMSRKRDEIYLLDAKEIHRVYTENQSGSGSNSKRRLSSSTSSYQLLQVLPSISCDF